MKIFISYSSEDKKLADSLATSLTKVGIECWLDHQSIRTGDDVKSAIGKALESSDAVIFLLSEKSTKSAWISTEVAIALSSNKKIYPIITSDEVEPPILLRQYQWLNLKKNPDLDAAANTIKKSLLEKNNISEDVKYRLKEISAKQQSMELEMLLHKTMQIEKEKALKAKGFSLTIISLCTILVTIFLYYNNSYDQINVVWLGLGVFVGVIATELVHILRGRRDKQNSLRSSSHEQ